MCLFYFRHKTLHSICNLQSRFVTEGSLSGNYFFRKQSFSGTFPFGTYPFQELSLSGPILFRNFPFRDLSLSGTFPFGTHPFQELSISGTIPFRNYPFSGTSQLRPPKPPKTIFTTVIAAWIRHPLLWPFRWIQPC